MSKVAAYLQEHILGEVTVQPAILNAMSHDTSVLELVPEMVIFPRVTNDIRKVARFCWQLAEKGHVLPITARGSGSDQTGAAIGKGIILSLPTHMNTLFEYEPKQKLLRVQPGATTRSITDALRLHGVSIPPLLMSAGYGTIGGAIANNASGPLSGKYGAVGQWVYELEVVLANGEVLQTGRINKRDLNKKKGLQTFEGEVYRSLDNLIEDNRELIHKKINTELRDNVGYESIASVKRKDGSFDLTPLFVGSQGTLGITSEMIMRADFISNKWGVTIASFSTTEAARDTLDRLRDMDPSLLNYYDGDIFNIAIENGKKYKFYTSETKAVIIFGVDDFSERTRSKKLKKVAKLLTASGSVFISAEGDDANELLAACDATTHLLIPSDKNDSTPPLVDGAYVPPERFEDFSAAIEALAERHHVTLPLFGRALENIYYTRAVLQLHKVGDKQKLFKLLDEYSDCVIQHGGHLIGEAGEGRVKARFAYKNIDDDILQLFASVKTIFDPYGILNPGVKQPVEVKELVSMLRPDYDTASLLPYLPHI
jgi:FAD/FMN-containing dehydrogenase